MFVQNSSTRDSVAVVDDTNVGEPVLHDSDILSYRGQVAEDEDQFTQRKPLPQHNGLWAGQKEVK